MSQAERIYKIKRLLKNKKIVPLQTFLRELEVSPATFRRDLELLRDRMHMPIPYDRARGGYRLQSAEPGGERHELPGLWFSSRELHALLAFHHFLETLEPGLLASHIEPLRDRIEALLQGEEKSAAEIVRRVRILPQAARHAEPARFQIVSHALLARRRLRMRYYGRARNEPTQRTVSPQRLVHYRDNWYLDAWDHLRGQLRSFAVDRVKRAEELPQAARDVPEAELDEHYASSYGIFAGRANKTAVLVFSRERARWVADERWHPQQVGQFRTDGSYELRIPYRDARELVMDILRHGAEVEVLAPESLRAAVAEALRDALARYRGA